MISGLEMASVGLFWDGLVIVSVLCPVRTYWHTTQAKDFQPIRDRVMLLRTLSSVDITALLELKMKKV